jgi:hypothetical protein
MKPELLQAILAMDAYNRGYDRGLNVDGNQIGNWSVGLDSSILKDANELPLDVPASFYAMSYTNGIPRVIENPKNRLP